MQIFSSIGGAPYSKTGVKIIRLIRKGCANRPFFHISVMEKLKEPEEPVIEQIGNYDPYPNKFNEKLVGINFNRLDFWLREGAELTKPVLKLLGLAGYFPVHPDSLEDAWNNRKKISQHLEELRITAANFSTKEALKPEESTSAESLSESKESTSSETTKTVLASAESLSETTKTVSASSTESLSETTESISDESSSKSTETVSADPAECTSTSKKSFPSKSSPTSDSSTTSDSTPTSEGKS